MTTINNPTAIERLKQIGGMCFFLLHYTLFHADYYIKHIHLPYFITYSWYIPALCYLCVDVILHTPFVMGNRSFHIHLPFIVLTFHNIPSPFAISLSNYLLLSSILLLFPSLHIILSLSPPSLLILFSKDSSIFIPPLYASVVN